MTRTKKPSAQLHDDLAGAVREVLDRSPVPMNVAKLRSQLTGPFKVPAKLKDAFIALLAAEARADRIYEWPAAKYWIRNSRAWAEPLILAAADVPVASSKVIGAISKQFGKPAAQGMVGELIECGMLIRVPMFGGAKAKLCARIADEVAFRAELDAARLVIEAGYRRLGQKPASAETHENLATQVLDTLASLEPRKGLLVTAPRIYRALPGIPKSAIDEELLKLQDAHRVILHRHSNPQSSDELIGDLYVGACWRTQE